MPRTRKKELTIKSNETKIAFGIIIAMVGFAMLAAQTIYKDSDIKVFSLISDYLGYSSIAWGITILYFALRFFSDKGSLNSWRIQIGLIVISLATSVFLTFWIPKELIILQTDFSDTGGELGYIIHSYLDSSLGQILEFILIIFTYMVGLSFISIFKWEWIKLVFSSIGSGFEKMSQKAAERKAQVKTEEEQIAITDATAAKQSQEPEYMINHAHQDNQTAINMVEEKKGLPVKESEYVGNERSFGGEKEESASLLGEPQYTDWKYPSISLLKDPIYRPQNQEIHKKNAAIIEKTLQSFGVQSKVTNIAIGPTVVQYALSITVGTKVAKVRNLANDLALALATTSSTVRIEAPIPGTSLIGIEIPNPTPNFVYEKELMTKLLASKENFSLPLILGKSVSGQDIIKDLSDLPHLLVAGATGTGKSVGINAMLIGLLMTKSPDELRMILVDPKMVEMSPYNGIPHLLTPVITDMELVVNALQWAIEEMIRRYRMLKQVGVRKIKEYNQKLGYNAMPYIVIVIDEMADLMLSTGVDVESKIVRLTQMSRAVGIHLILATQRPSVDVITGLIKANVPARVAFSVATSIDSRVVIDQPGAETLIGKGDLLFKSPEYPRPIRVQGALTDIKDIEQVVDSIKEQTEEVHYFDEVTKPREEEKKGGSDEGDFSDDELFEDALNVIVNAQKASASLLQRRLRIGYNRAARLIDELQEAGAIGPADGSNPRKVLITSPSQLLGHKQSEQSQPQDIMQEKTVIEDEIYEETDNNS